jgi:hypothetical protein
MYTVIYPTGKVMVFRVKEVAELYAFLNCGTLVTNDAVVEQKVAA